MFSIKSLIKVIAYFILIGAFIIIAFINISPELGGNPSKNQRKTYETFKNYKNGEFHNLELYQTMTGEMSMTEFFRNDSNRRPIVDIIPEKMDIKDFSKIQFDKIKISWLGHSAFILNINGNIILLDPMLGDYAAPIPIPSLERYNSESPLNVDEIKEISAVIFSHDHYDHLNYPTIKKIKNKVKKYFVPHGMGSHLMNWGIESEKIIELNWEESVVFNDIEFVCLPALHFSGRGIFNKNSTLWASWALKSDKGKIYFSGDSGYGNHFKNIGNVHGPFDLALIDCGQYNVAWKYSHMFPEQAIQAAKDLKSEYFMPIHWGAFTLSTHSWTEPVISALDYAESSNQKIVTPRIGQVFYIPNELNIDGDFWWRKF